MSEGSSRGGVEAQAEKAKNEARAGFLQVYPLSGKYRSIDQYVQQRRAKAVLGAAAAAQGHNPPDESFESSKSEALKHIKRKIKSA